MKEIGGYLEFEHFNGKEYHNNMLRFNTVRNSIEYIIKARKFTKVHIPYYLCHSVCDMLIKAKVDYKYYHIDTNLFPIINSVIDSNEVVLIVNYFGTLDEKAQLDLKKRYSNIILDNTQSFFQLPVQGIDTVYTCRKYFGVPDGAYLSSEIAATDYLDLEQDKSNLRMNHLLGRFEYNAQKYYSAFDRNDESLANQDIKRMSKLTQNILCGIDYSFVKDRRQKNYLILDSYLQNKNQLNSKQIGLYMYPFLHSKGATIKHELILSKIYVPTLWPNVLSSCSPDTWEYYLANNLVLLPIDQRYNETDMDYIISKIKDII